MEPLVPLCKDSKDFKWRFYDVYQCPFKKMKIDLILLTKIEEGEHYTAWVLFYENSLSTFA